MSPIPSDNSNNGGGLRGLIFGPGGAAALSGMIEISVFHPFDTCSKRLMRNTRQVVVPGNGAATRQNVKSVVFAGMKVNGVVYEELIAKHLAAAAAAPSSSNAPHHLPHIPVSAYLYSLYPGSVYAVYYKVSQRFIKFAGQPYVKDWMQHMAAQRQHKNQQTAGKNSDRNSSRDSIDGRNSNTDSASSSSSAASARRTKLFFEASAGSIVGMSEVVLLPIDRMKVLSQTNAKTLQGKSMLTVVAEEGVRKMYAAAGTTMFRNCIGSFLLFGGSALTKEFVFGLEDYRKATVAQNLFASAVGATMGVLTTSPMDVVKTRLQSRNLTTAASTGAAPPMTALRVVSETLKAEGPQAFFKGITPKVITTAPKLIFSYTFSLYCTEKLRQYNGQVQK